MAYLQGTMLLDNEGKILVNDIEEILLAKPYTDNYLSKAELEWAVRSYITEPIFKIELLNRDESPFEDISGKVIGETINYSQDFKNGQIRSLSFNIINDDGSYFPSHVGKIWHGTKIRLCLGLLVGNRVVFFPRGIFAVKDAGYNSGIVSIQTADKFGLIDGTISGTTESLYKIVTQSAKVIKTIESLLLLDDGSGFAYDTNRIMYPTHYSDGRPTNFESVDVPYTIDIDRKNSIGGIIIKLAEVLSCNVFYDDWGHLTLEPFNEIIDLSQREIDWFYKDGECQFEDASMNIKFSDVYNKVMVVGANINGYLFDYTAENTNPASPTSTQNSPVRFKYIEDSNIYTDELCKVRAEYELQLATMLSVPVSFASIYIPFLSVNHLIEYTNDTILYGQGGRRVFDREKLLIVSLGFSGKGTINVSAKNIKELPFHG